MALGLAAGGFGAPLASAMPTGSALPAVDAIPAAGAMPAGSTIPTEAGAPATENTVPLGGPDGEGDCSCTGGDTGISTGSAALAGLALGGLTFGLLS
ncbi:hypothetical protein EGT50_11295 [Rhodococcus xishaensis]|uniref:Uncharacterized protein n=1 Tax=Rhodococcus xishaensis TaxID=2487364 RepID=A0A3S3ADK3_9NOCA|nr:hypothetical protein EGT50_11295 [Rhodococcus xishaensis]